MKYSTFSMLALVTLIGCNGMGEKSGVITGPPSNWQTLEGKTVTLEGSAGNSPAGAILRFRDGSWIGLQGIRLWPMNVVTKPVGVTGTVIRGSGARDGEYVIDAKEWYLQTVTQVPTQVQK